MEVPDFQRNFSWELPFVETFWQDILSFSRRYPENTFREQEYFIGPVVLVTPRSGSPRKILDGQQRLATSTILLSVIRDSLREHGNSDAATRTQENYIAGFNDFRRAYTYHLTMNQYDREFFRREIQELRNSDGYIPPEPEQASHKLIRKARNYFLEQFGRMKNEFGQNTAGFLQWMIRIEEIVVNHLSLVFVDSETEDNASLVFETLNDRGIGLSAPDLLRNFLLSRALPAQREGIVDYWREILQIEEKAGVEDFLRHYWLSREGDVKARSLYREIKTNILDKNADSLTLSGDLQGEALVYEKIVTAEEEDTILKALLEGNSLLGAKATLPVILSTYAIGNLEQKRALVKDLVTLQIRHNTVGGLENNRLESFLFSLARELRTHADFTQARRKIKDFAPNDSQFQDRFKVAEITKSSAARYILMQIEYSKRLTGELQVASIARVNLEHIYPENPSGARLPNHNSIVDRIGNLTLFSRRLNTNIKNADFRIKRPLYQDSDFHITREVAAHNEWTEDTIARRQEEFSRIALSIWQFD